ncbi:AMP-binding protein [Pseudoalteromonas piscicida]
MSQVNNIVDCIRYNALNKPNEIAYEFLTDLVSPTTTITYAELYKEVKQISNGISRHLAQGDCALLLFPPGIEYIKAFFACLMVGVIAIPLYPPKKNSKADKVFKVAELSNAKIALTADKDIIPLQNLWKENCKSNVRFLSTGVLVSEELDSSPTGFEIDVDAPAFLQYTSGSTGNPKGVIITQNNIFANTKYLERLSGANEKDVFVNWLPLFHDLGLVTTVLLPAYLGCKSVLMAPATFVKHPAIWLKAITKFGGTIAGAPNFAFDLCTDKIPTEELVDIDLSQWRIAYNAAEPVKYQTLQRFSERFSAVGFNFDSFYPSYGMAESTAFISGGNGVGTPSTLLVDKSSLADNILKVSEKNSNSNLTFVGNGFTDDEHLLKVVDPDTNIEVEEGIIGEVWFSGPSVSPGYWGLEQASKETFLNTLSTFSGRNFLRTGDLGFVFNNDLYITGRKKDLIILNGKNYYPQDIEETVKYCHRDIHPGHTAAFEYDNQLIVVTEVTREALRANNFKLLIQEISRSVYVEHSVSIHDIILLPPYKIPMTSSGKIRRKETKEQYTTGRLPSIFNKVGSEQVVRPSGTIENEIYRIWTQILGLPNICVERGFYELGGNSIQATQIVGDVQSFYSTLNLDETELLECTNIKEMAQLITLVKVKQNSSSDLRGAVRI